jgi:hypothetical protein
MRGQLRGFVSSCSDFFEEEARAGIFSNDTDFVFFIDVLDR